MKKLLLLYLFILLVVSCDQDVSNQVTSVEGIVTDYFTKMPVPDIPVVVIESENFCFIGCDNVILDTLFSNTKGHYYYEFYNDSNRSYTVSAIRSENYFQDYKSIKEGKKNIIDLSIKPYKPLYLNCYNKSKKFNRLFVHSNLNNYEFSCNQCDELTVVVLKMVPEYINSFFITVSHYNDANKIDMTNQYFFNSFLGINDTTINYYY
jgi:hypothetical protein